MSSEWKQEEGKQVHIHKEGKYVVKDLIRRRNGRMVQWRTWNIRGLKAKEIALVEEFEKTMY